ncbi:MAG: ABC transporter permease subunit, partial [Oscillospiraceae bacterium]|nr:ABC transporter permease subunit [Oscillospiraceae bacterium]
MSDKPGPVHQNDKSSIGKLNDVISAFPMRVNATIAGTVLVLVFSLLEWVNMGLGVRFNLFTLQIVDMRSRVTNAGLEWVFGDIDGFMNFKAFMTFLLFVFVVGIILLVLSIVRHKSKRFMSLSYWGFGAIIFVSVAFIFAILITVGDMGTKVLSAFPLCLLAISILTMFLFPFETPAKLLNYVKRYWVLYILFILPFAQIIIFRYGPMINILAAFKDNMFLWPVLDRPWSGNGGFEFFIAAFNDPTFLEALRNTLMLSFLEIIMGFPVPIILAILLNELRLRKFKRVAQTILYLPHFLSWAIVAGIATTVLGTSGLLNNFLRTSVPFLQDPTNWVFSYIIIGIWKGMGWGTIIYLAAITGINPELYEAAAVDGAKRFRLIWHITLPGIRSVIILLLILNIGGIMGNSFERIMAMRNPLVFRFSDVIEVFTYNRGV